MPPEEALALLREQRPRKVQTRATLSLDASRSCGSALHRKVAAEKPKIVVTTMQKYLWCPECIVPRWKDTHLKNFRAKKVMDWLRSVRTHGTRYVASEGNCQEVGGLREAQPVNGGDARILARLEKPNLLICETRLDSGTHISEVTGLLVGF